MFSSDPLAEKLAPEFQLLLQQHRPELLARAKNGIERAAIMSFFPLLVRESPLLVEILVKLARDHCGKITINELLDDLAKRGA